MVTLTSNYQLLAQSYVGKSGGSLYVRLYAKCSRQDIENNKSYVYYQARTYYENGTYILDSQGSGNVSGTDLQTKSGSATRPTTGEQVIATTEGWIYHDSEGKKTISAKAFLNFPNWGWSATASSSANLVTIPRASSISVANYNLGQNISIIIGKKVSSFTSTLSYKIGSYTGTIVSKTSNSTFVWTMDSTLIEKIKESNTNSKSISAEIYCDTYSGNTKIGSTKTAKFTLSITDKPIISNVLVTEANQKVKKYTTKVIKYLSALQFDIDAISSAGTEIAHYKVKCDDREFISTTSDVFVTNIQYSYLVSGDRKTKFVITAVDKRGNTSDGYELIMDFVEYINLTFNNTEIKINRINSVSNFVRIYIQGLFFNGTIENVKNTIKIQYRYKLRNDDTASWSELKNIDVATNDNDNVFIIDNIQLDDEFNYKKNYDIEFVAEDIFQSTLCEKIVNTSEAIVKLHKNGAYIKELTAKTLNVAEGFSNYSLDDEIVVGKWIDNKKIYRKVYHFFEASACYISLKNISIDNVVNIYGYEMSAQYNNIPFNFYNNKFNYLYVEDKIIKCKTGWCNEGYIVVEYTKEKDDEEGE